MSTKSLLYSTCTLVHRHKRICSFPPSTTWWHFRTLLRQEKKTSKLLFSISMCKDCVNGVCLHSFWLSACHLAPVRSSDLILCTVNPLQFSVIVFFFSCFRRKHFLLFKRNTCLVSTTSANIKHKRTGIFFICCLMSHKIHILQYLQKSLGGR